MESFQGHRTITGLVLCLVAGGCALTPAPETPQLVVGIRKSEGFDQLRAKISSPSDPQAWWLDIGGEELGELVSILRRDSLVLHEARLQADQTLEAARIARGQRLPSFAAIGEIGTSRTPGLGGDFSWSEAYTAGVLTDFNTDVFGGLRAAKRSAELNAIASELSVQASEQREIAFLARSWVSAATLKRRLDLARRTADTFRATYELTSQRYEAGSTSVSASDVQIALQNLETALVDIPQIDTDLTQQWFAIDEQLARLPGQTRTSFTGMLSLSEPFEAPVGRPAEILSRRPDVAIAEVRYLAALEDVGSARALLYPAISLSASLTFQADTPNEVFDWDRHIASLTNSLTAPIFQGGRLKSQVRLEKSRAEELANAFARTALAAVVDVEVALAELAGLQEQKDRLEAALATAIVSNELAQGRYRQGLASILAVLETQRSLNAAEQNIILTDQAIANARIDLFLSLGGDWTGEMSAPSQSRIPHPDWDDTMSEPDDLLAGSAPEAHARTGHLNGILQVILVIGVLAAGLIANRVLSSMSAAPQIRAAGSSGLAASVVQPEIGDTRIRLLETGTVQVRNSIELSPQVGGRVVWVNPALASGGTFRRGEVLFRLDDADYRAAIDRARADLAARRADLQVEQAEAEIAIREWELVNPGEPVPSNVAREPQLARTEAAVRSAQTSLADAERNLSRVNFSLPFDGRVQATAVEVGQNLMAGQSYGRAYEDGGIEVSVPINAALMEALSPLNGREAIVRPRQVLTLQGDVTYAATVTRADAELDPQTRLARLTLEFTEQIPLLPGDFVDVEITGPVVTGTYRFPEAALQENRNVWVIEDGRLAQRQPQLVFVDDGVISTLPFDTGEGIVVGSLNDPEEGDPVVAVGDARADGVQP